MFISQICLSYFSKEQDRLIFAQLSGLIIYLFDYFKIMHKLDNI